MLVLAGFVFVALAKSHHFKREEEDYDDLTSQSRYPRTNDKRNSEGDHHRYGVFEEGDDEPYGFENPELPHHLKHQKDRRGI